MNELEQHHVKYKEIHGEDEIVMLSREEHRALHRRLRREGKCNVPGKELEKISDAARYRSPRGKEVKRRYCETVNGKSKNKGYESHRKSRVFTRSLGKNISFQEEIKCNLVTEHVSYSARFRGKHGHTLPVVEVS